MGSLSRRKGANGEREFAHTLEELLNLPDGSFRRRLAQYQAGGHDLETCAREDLDPDSQVLMEQIGQFAIEIKRHAQASPGDISEWWKQTCSQARECARTPLLAFRADRETWQCLLPLSEEMADSNVKGALRMDICLFAEFMRRHGWPRMESRA